MPENMSGKDKTIKAAFEKMATLPTFPTEPTVDETLAYMQKVSAIYADIYDAGVREGRAEKILESINPADNG